MESIYTVLGVHFFSYANKKRSGEQTNACVISVAIPANNSKDERSWGFNCKEYFISASSPVYLQAQDLKKEDKIRISFNEQGYVNYIEVQSKK